MGGIWVRKKYKPQNDIAKFFKISNAPNFDFVVIYFLSTLKPASAVKSIPNPHPLFFFLNAQFGIPT